MRRLLLLCWLASVSSACADDDPADLAEDDDGKGGDADPVEVQDFGPRGDCNPVDPSHCLMPFPSGFYLVDDPTTPTGKRVRFGPGSLPKSTDGVVWQPEHWNRKDGFPVLGSLFALIPGVDLNDVIGLEDLGAYEDADARTVILRASDGARLAHFVEHDQETIGTDRQLLALRPATPMENGARYVVGIRGPRREADGRSIEAPSTFASLRDGGDPTDDPDLERQRGHYDAEIFPVLESAGFDRQELQLAWDFTTVSMDGTTRVARHLVTDALERVGESGATYVIDAQEEADCEEDGATIGRTLELTLDVPRYVEPSEPGGVFVLGDDGLPRHLGTRAIAMTVRIPCSLLTAPDRRPGRLVQYGHGLFGEQDEVRDGYLGEMAQRYGWILFCIDWTGMSRDDVVEIVDMLQRDRSEFRVVPDRLQQGFAEAAVAARSIRPGALADDPAMRASNGSPLVDPATLWFYGNSQGAVVGGAYVAVSPDIERAVLGVGGAPFSFLATRATGFSAFRYLLLALFDDPVDAEITLPLAQMLWDPGESAGWVNAMDKPILQHVAVGDRSVPTFGAHMLARGWGSVSRDSDHAGDLGTARAGPPLRGQRHRRDGLGGAGHAACSFGGA